MRAMVLSDIHGNEEALSSVLKEAADLDWQEIWFLGDLCGYGPNSVMCLEILKKYKVVFLTGNHDLYMTGDMDKDFFSDMARIALIIGRAHTTPELLSFLSHQPPRNIYRGYDLVHGCPQDPAGQYILSAKDARRNLPHARKKIVLYGHSHLQEYYDLTDKKNVDHYSPGRETICFRGKRMMINPGSVGQPRDGDNRAAWGLIDTKTKEFSFYRTPYDYTVTQEKMREQGYPAYLIERLARGQ
ncbi:MAG: metallophosphoesterase family protein [Spirochaetales bacterium]|nr:metallophosphoesterase family protein [Spirochaetales bacterium]